MVSLNLALTDVSDAGLKSLSGLSNHQRLSLAGTVVSDAGLSHLEGLNQLRELNLNFTRVGAEGVLRLRQRLPECDVTIELIP